MKLKKGTRKKIKAVRVKPKFEEGDICTIDSLFSALFPSAFIITKIYYGLSDINNLVFDGIYLGSGMTITGHLFDSIKKIGHTDLISQTLKKATDDFCTARNVR